MKRIATTFLVVMLLLSCSLPASASMTRESLYLSYYYALAQAGTRSGEIKINVQVRTDVSANSLGATKIEIYSSGGSRVATITGSTSNGLLTTNAASHRFTYTYKGASGGQYYAKVTVMARTSSGSDSKTVTTTTVTAP